jgi:hypothetical protein
VFTGTIAYTNADAVTDGGVTEYLNGDHAFVDLPATLDDSGFNTNAPLSMNPGDSWSGVIFTVTAPPFTAGSSNDYSGYFAILGGSSPSDGADQLGLQNFDIQVTPEPTSLLLLTSGLIVLLATMKLRAV